MMKTDTRISIIKSMDTWETRIHSDPVEPESRRREKEIGRGPRHETGEIDVTNDERSAVFHSIFLGRIIRLGVVGGRKLCVRAEADRPIVFMRADVRVFSRRTS